MAKKLYEYGEIKYKPCKKCGNLIQETAKICGHCGASQSWGCKTYFAIGLIIVLVILILLAL